MNRDQARAGVIELLHRRGVGRADGIAIIDARTIEKSYGWVFFYNSRRYVESGELVHALVGQGPVVVVVDRVRLPWNALFPVISRVVASA